MIRPTMAITVLLALPLAGAVQTVDQTKLRDAIRLPLLVINFQFSVDSEGAYGDPTDFRALLDRLRKSLHGDSSDADTYVRIGLISESPLNDNKQAQDAYRQAIPLLRKQSEAHPQDAALMTKLGAALSYAHQDEEAEKLLREAVRIAPNNGKAWAELGRFVQSHAQAQIIGNQRIHFNFNFGAPPQTTLQQALSKKPDPQLVTQLQKATAEGEADIAKAIALAPAAPDLYSDRADFFAADSQITQKILRTAQGQPQEDTLFIPPNARADLWKAAELAPADTRRLAYAAFMEMLAGIAAAGDKISFGQPGNLDRMPPEIRDRVRAAMERLRTSADDKTPAKAAIAAATLTAIHFFDGDLPETERWAKRTLAIDPAGHSAWDALCSTALAQKHYQDLAPLLEARLKAEDTAYNRLLLAKVYREQSKDTPAFDLITSALPRFPNDLLLNLAAADVWMKRSDPDALKKAQTILEHAVSLFEAMSVEEKRPYRTNLDLTHAAYLALIGKDAVAKNVIKNLLTDDPDNANALELQKALGDSPP